MFARLLTRLRDLGTRLAELGRRVRRSPLLNRILRRADGKDRFQEMAGRLGEALERRTNTRERRFLARFCAALLALMWLYTLCFRLIMIHEGQEHSWFSGLYWTLTTMSTLGFGDITFKSDVGRFFSAVVLLSGMVLLITMLPFIFIQFFYVPWLARQNEERAPRAVPKDLRGHVILTHFDHVAAALIDKLGQYGAKHVIVCPDLNQALDLHDRGYRVLFAGLDDPDTYRRARADQAAMVVVLNDDVTATNIVFTIREVSVDVPIAANADQEDSVDILKLAGCTHVFQFTTLLGQSLARRILGVSMTSNIVGEFGRLRIAEAPVMGAWMQGKTIAETQLRQKAGVNIVGLWQEGAFRLPTPETVLDAATVLILAGTLEQLVRFDQTVLSALSESGESGESAPQHPVLILGGGRVGQAIGDNLRLRGISYRVVEKKPQHRAAKDQHIIQGSAADREVLEQAGINETPAIIVTTHDDDLNIYLTIYCRRLRPDAQIISRASFDRNINTLHRAGANLVMSHSSLITATITNLFRPEQMLMLSEGLNVFRLPLHPRLEGKRLTELRLRRDTGCSVVAIKRDDHIDVNPDPSIPLARGDELVLIGSIEAEKRYHELYPSPPAPTTAASPRSKPENGSAGSAGADAEQTIS